MRVVYYNILDNVAFNSVGHCTWYTWMDLCNLLCNPIYVEIKIMQWISVYIPPIENKMRLQINYKKFFLKNQRSDVDV